MCSSPRIAIAGAGPAGLTLATLLHKHGIPFTIFELRSKPTPEEWAIPSGMLDLHEPSGLLAIHECGVYDEFLIKTAECTEEFIVADKDGNKLHVSGGENRTSPEISRNNLSQLLLGQIPEEMIQGPQVRV
ncbi:hypothetical protein NQ176_g4441 [Zarea fungicola]|uniref:Uncharacterized protein n=1 Tax=Zarea fungicola TaxID=93591 RepID=A0ACC1NDD5_9HYPO|nr:hypothetical protein NQ176_g4441 [Lecanicillium fungicola]